ncbi:MAG: SDR family oxidoreductase [Bacteroidia bacterium]|nr:SDR family oxidoreductase [Bacteroidia bacterium]
MIILITGGASGLGESITEKLCADKLNTVYFTYHKSQAAAKNLEERFANAKSISCNFEDTEQMNALLALMDEIHPEVLINNAFAGNIGRQHFHKDGSARFEDDFAKNILPVIKITQKAIGIFRKKKFGKIITILSAALVNKPPIGWSEYVAGKAYLHSLSKSWATENAAFNITSNCVSPSFMQTTLTSDTDERLVEAMIQAHPLKKLLTGQEVADAVNYLVNASQQVNGTNLILNAASDII